MLETELKVWLENSKRIVIAGIGNPIRKDDFVGTKIVQDLTGKVSKKVYLIECETVPESFLQEIIDYNPTHVLILDAAILEIPPGETKLLTQENIADQPAISTHILPLRVFCEYLSQTIKPKLALLLIQPKDIEFGEGLSPEVQKSARKITKLLIGLLS